MAEDTLGEAVTASQLNDMALIIQTDPDDLIFPRTATRQGPKFQAVVPPAPDRDAVLTPGKCHKSIYFKKLTLTARSGRTGWRQHCRSLGQYK